MTPDSASSRFANAQASFKRGVNKALWMVGGALVLAFVIAMLVMTYGTYSTGVRAGTIVKVSKRGYLMKTYEGQLSVAITGGTNEGTIPMAQMWDFSVRASDTEVVEKLESAALKGERVRLGYDERYVTLPWMGDTKYFVTRVEGE